MSAETGWQTDGTYVPCPVCGWEPEPDRGPGVLVRWPGTTHHRTCSRVPDLSPSPELLIKLREIEDAHRRAAASVHNYFIGGRRQDGDQ